MITTIIVGAVCLVVGFGIGRIKNAAKLAAIKNEVDSWKNHALSEVRSLAAAIRAHL